MLRALFVIAAILTGLRYAVRGPFYVLLFYVWIAYFRPEQWLWFDFVSRLDLSFFVGLFLLASTLLSAERSGGGSGPLLLLGFLAFGLFSTLVSPHFDAAWAAWTTFAKTIVVSCLMVGLVTNEWRLRWTLVLMAFSLGFEGAKQGWAGFLLHPGGNNINTLPMLGDNNGVAIGMLMITPLLTALGNTAPTKAERYIDRFFAVGVLYRALVTYSRGGFLACMALGGHLLMRSKHKIAVVLAIVLLIGVIVPVLPQAFWDRMNTIAVPQETEGATETAKQNAAESSISGRLHFWAVAFHMAEDSPLTGVGFGAYKAAYNRFDTSLGQFGANRQVHSMWFGILAELGFPGLAMFVLLFVIAFLNCRHARRLAKTRPDLAALGQYATAVEAGLLVVSVGGTFLAFQYFEILWHFLALSMIIGRIATERAASPPLPAPS